MGFDVYCYGMDEPGGPGMPNQLQRTLEIHARQTLPEKVGHFDVALPQFWNSLKQVPFFINYAHNLLNANIHNHKHK